MAFTLIATGGLYPGFARSTVDADGSGISAVAALPPEQISAAMPGEEEILQSNMLTELSAKFANWLLANPLPAPGNQSVTPSRAEPLAIEQPRSVPQVIAQPLPQAPGADRSVRPGRPALNLVLPKEPVTPVEPPSRAVRAAGGGKLAMASLEVPRQGRSPIIPVRPLTLRELFESASATHPSMQAARLEVQASSQDKTAVERQRWPTISVTTESEASKNSSGIAGSRLLSVDQVIWDAGRNSARIGEAESQVQMSLVKASQQQLELFLQIVSGWQNMVNALERLRYSEEALERLRGYQQQMERRVEAQASPRIDLELSIARVLQTEVELTTSKTSLQVAMTRLEQLSSLEGLGVRVNSERAFIDRGEVEEFARRIVGLDWLTVAAEMPAVQKARLDKAVVESRLAAKRAEMWPQLYARANQPLGKHDYIKNTDPTVFVGMKYTPGAGLSNLAESEALALRIQGQDQYIEAAMRDSYQTLQNDRDEFVNSRLRVDSLARSVDGSAQVLESYLRQFQAGRKTWQDLLNAARDLVQNQYSLADARASMVGAMLRIELRMGQSPHFP